MLSISQTKGNGPTRAGIGKFDSRIRIRPKGRLGALLYCNVDARKALQGDQTLTRDVDSIVNRLLQELMRPKLRKSSFAYGTAEGVCWKYGRFCAPVDFAH